jgi:hypothetical protein
MSKPMNKEIMLISIKGGLAGMVQMACCPVYQNREAV